MELIITKEIVEGCKQNNRIQQNMLYKLTFGYMMSVCRRYANNKEDALSLLNIGFVKIVQNIDKYELNKPAIPWIKTVLINTIIDELRKSMKHKMHIVTTDQIENTTIYDWHHIFNDGEARLMARHLEQAIQSIPDQTRQIFNLFVMEEYSHREISEILGITEVASRWHVHKAKKILHDKLKDMYHVPSKIANDQ
ncbi:MAG: sigma-70 family RNA polymerase sigma factor [Bacteroidetes bacterium]|nr:sigma-70 family RNA polymerase sigma factor [Bacteroidota bacterium]